MSSNSTQGSPYPDNMLPYIQKGWYKVAVKRTKCRIPSDNNIRRLLDVASQASLCFQEKQSVRVRIVLCRPEQLTGDLTSTPRNRPIEFNHPRTFNVPEIVQLAPAVDPRQLMIGVRPIRENSKNDSGTLLEIWGLVDTGHSWLEYSKGESRGLLAGSPPPDCLIVSIMSPGGLVVSRAEWPIVSLEKGSLSLPMTGVFSSGPIGNSLNRMYSGFYNDACKSLRRKQYDPKGWDEDYPKRFLIKFIGRILLRVRDRRHGGTILVIPDDWQVSDATLQHILDIKYPLENPGIWSILVQNISLDRRFYEKLLPAFNYKKVSKDLFRGINRLRYEYEDAIDLVRDQVNFVASLTNVDGSVVITTKLGLRGFGAEVIAQSPALHEIKIATDVYGKSGVLRPFTDYGTRHRSAFRFCFSDERLIAFVVSQDGEIRAAKRVGSNVILWPSIIGESLQSLL